MGSCFSVSLSFDQVLDQVFQWVYVKLSYIRNLEVNIIALETSMKELKAKRDDLSREVDTEENKGLRRLAQVQVWLTNVDTIENSVSDLLSSKDVEFQRLFLYGICSHSLHLSYKYGERAFKTLEEVRNLKSTGDFEVVAVIAPTSEVVERPTQPIVVGQKTMLETVWNRLKEDGIGTIGLYGMGGVGKTTLLKQINNHCGKANGFDMFIWIVVSRVYRIQKVQEDIAAKLGLVSEDWNQKDRDQKACDIHNVLGRKKFVLLLDDVWEKVSLSDIGVPYPNRENGCKLVFTTRSQEVCGRMGVNVSMEVRCLEHQDALALFCKKAGNITLESDPDLFECANVIVEKCQGLPLALNVVGKTMASKREIQEWEYAISILNSYAGMEDEILSILMSSYDNLEEEEVKSCLIYCALYPKDFRFCKDDLIERLIGEEIIDASEGIEKAENNGYEIIGSLLRASLLMEDDLNGKAYVHMHDVVREMGLWIANDFGKQKETFIVHAGVGLNEMPNVKNWKVVRKMSLMNNNIQHLRGNPDCPELTTLLLQNMKLASISSEFLKSMPQLVVLDLSENHRLKVLPCVSELISLQYLNLSHTDIRQLPSGLQELKKLLHLDLEHTRFLMSIVGISRLKKLIVLKLEGSGFTWDLNIEKEIESLKHLEHVSTKAITTHPHLEKFMDSYRLTSCSQKITIKSISNKLFGLALPVTTKKLHSLCILDCSVSGIKIVERCVESKRISLVCDLSSTCFLNLSKVTIGRCKSLKDLSFLLFAPNLKTLYLRKLDQLEDIISEKACEGKGSKIVPFSKIESLGMWYLPNLKSIYWSHLPLRCLKVLCVVECPNLKKLPLDSQSCMGGENGVVIRYDREWIEGVEWEDEATKALFMPKGKLWLKD